MSCALAIFVEKELQMARLAAISALQEVIDGIKRHGNEAQTKEAVELYKDYEEKALAGKDHEAFLIGSKVIKISESQRLRVN